MEITQELLDSLNSVDAIVQIEYNGMVDWFPYVGYEDNDGKISILVNINGEEVAIPSDKIFKFEVISSEDFSQSYKLVLSINEELWSGEVVAKWSPPPGLFANGTAEEIANELKKASKSLKQAMSRINFYINRAGRNLKADRIKVLEKAKELLHKLFGG